jgi:hypothetical protein
MMNHAVSEGSTNREISLPGINGRLCAKQISSSSVRRHPELLNPMPPPDRRLDGIPEILCFVDDLAIAELRVYRLACER